MDVIQNAKRDSEQNVAKKAKNMVQEGPKIRAKKRQKLGYTRAVQKEENESWTKAKNGQRRRKSEKRQTKQKEKGLASKETKGGQREQREQEEGSSVTRCIV